MTIRVRLFAILRQRAGRDTVEVELADGATVADALQELARLPGLAEPIERMPVRMAVNREYAAAAPRLAAEEVLAVTPPISGGAAAVHVAVSEQPLDAAALQ